MADLSGIRVLVNQVLSAQADPALAAEGWVHLYGVAEAAALLAGRRTLDASICASAGLLHDIYTFRTGEEADHARLGAAESETMLRSAGGFTEDDVRVISHMILRHSDKAAVDGNYEECLKDADVLAHWLYEPAKKFDAAKAGRVEHVLQELQIQGSICRE